jgi:hypothetical protein
MMGPGEAQQRGSGRLQRLVLDRPGNRLGVERPGGEHAALGVLPGHAITEQIAEQVLADHHHGQQVGGEAERIHAEPETPGA